MIDGYKYILEKLYDKYYVSSSEYSDVTSSYWRTIGKQKVLKKKNGYQVSGSAFGSYRTKNMINYLKDIPMKILLSYFCSAFVKVFPSFSFRFVEITADDCLIVVCENQRS